MSNLHLYEGMLLWVLYTRKRIFCKKSFSKFINYCAKKQMKTTDYSPLRILLTQMKANVYKFLISVVGQDYKIWGEVEVSSNYTLAKHCDFALDFVSRSLKYNIEYVKMCFKSEYNLL